ncbi:MAG: Ribosomal RNA small subunit methyltransferase A [Firmicutes bacterium ADurb.Bin354]|nr:MAG: Ribosomal RNA small subunit methyltransferase A [Firmicutes bacterium ADurb.Bin354]
MVIRLDRYKEPPVTPRDPDKMFKLIRASFNHRRKTLSNGLSTDPSLGLSREKVTEALEKMGLPVDIRGEKLDLAQFAELSDQLC